jgi:death-on-curing protein
MKSKVREIPVGYREGNDRGPRFLTQGDVVLLHGDIITRFDGVPGVTDAGALAMAITQPRRRILGQLVHPTLIDQAAAYLFHLITARPFRDGNKRTGLFAAFFFLHDNGIEVVDASEEWHALTLAVAEGQLTLAELKVRFAPFVRYGG